MDLEEMKRQWADLNSRIENIETRLTNQKPDKMKTAQQQLIIRYRAFACLAAAFIGISFVIFSHLFEGTWIPLAFAAFFAACAAMDFILQHKVGEIDLGTMSVIEVAEKAAACRRLHHIFQLILIPSLIILLVFMASATDNKPFIYGMCVGGGIGLAFGLKAYFSFMSNYKSLTNS